MRGDGIDHAPSRLMFVRTVIDSEDSMVPRRALDLIPYEVDTLPQVPAIEAPYARPRPDRRNAILRESLRHRIVREFEEMHGTVLTVAQATRLLHLPAANCTRILAELVREGRLRVRDGRYRRRGDIP